jgi:hypothetical protein
MARVFNTSAALFSAFRLPSPGVLWRHQVSDSSASGSELVAEPSADRGVYLPLLLLAQGGSAQHQKSLALLWF